MLDPFDTTAVFTKEANLTGLIKDESYNVSVLATTEKGNGPYSVPIILTTNENSEYFETFIWNSKTNTVAALFFLRARSLRQREVFEKPIIASSTG